MCHVIVRPFLILFFLSASCTQKYKRTVKVCEGNLFVELYNINPAGVDAHYLTDSTNFRMFVGEFDNEHENYSYVCNGDTLTIRKLQDSIPGTPRRVTNTRVFSIGELKKKGSFE